MSGKPTKKQNPSGEEPKKGGKMETDPAEIERIKEEKKNKRLMRKDEQHHGKEKVSAAAVEKEKPKKTEEPNPSSNNNPRKNNKEEKVEEKEKESEKEQNSGMHSVLSHLSEYKEATTRNLRECESAGSLHPIFIEIALQMKRGIISGSNNKCISLLNGLKIVFKEYKTPENVMMSRDLERIIDRICNFFQEQGLLNEGMETSKKILKYLSSYVKHDTLESDAKEWLIKQTNDIITQKITNAHKEMIKIGLQLVSDDEIIMIYGKTPVVMELLKTAHKENKKFKVVVVDNPPFNEGKESLANLSNADIPCIYTHLNSAAKFLKRVSKIFVGAKAMLNNGSLISRVGTAALACMANNFRVPFVVFCETYKFSERSQIDSLACNEMADPSYFYSNIPEIGGEPKYTLINLRYDLTPISYINMIVTELGKVPATSVPVILREFSKVNFIGKIKEIPRSQVNKSDDIPEGN